MFVFGGVKVVDAEKKKAIKTLRERLSDGTQPVAEQLKQARENGLHIDVINLQLAVHPVQTS